MTTDQPDHSTAPPARTALPGSRRTLLGAGLAGLATSLLPRLGGTAAASAPPGTGGEEDDAPAEGDGPTPSTSSPRRPTETDIGLLAFVQPIEIATRDLYEQALRGDALDDAARPVFEHLRESHDSYGQSLSATLGTDADTSRSAEVYDAYEAVFTGSDLSALLAAAYELEATLLATHTELVGTLEATEGAQQIASIAIMNARHCTVLADLAGEDDLDVLLLSDADALALPEG